MPRGGPSSQRAGRDQGTHGPGIGHPDPDSAAPSLSPASRQVCKVEGQSRGGGCLLNTSPGLDPCKPPRSVLGKNFPGVTCLAKAVTAACHLQNQRQPPGCFQSNRASAPPMGAAGLCHCVLAPLWGQVPLKSNLEPPTPTASPPGTTGATFHPQGLPGPALYPRPSSPSSEHQEPSGP